MRNEFEQVWRPIDFEKVWVGNGLRSLENLSFGHPNFYCDIEEIGLLNDGVPQLSFDKPEIDASAEFNVDMKKPMYLICTHNIDEEPEMSHIRGITQSLVGAAVMTHRMMCCVDMMSTGVAVFRYEAENDGFLWKTSLRKYESTVVPVWSSLFPCSAVVSLRTTALTFSEKGFIREVETQLMKGMGIGEKYEGLIFRAQSTFDSDEFYGVDNRLSLYECEAMAIELIASSKPRLPVNFFMAEINRHATKVSNRIRQIEVWEFKNDMRNFLMELKFLSNQTMVAWSNFAGIPQSQLLEQKDLYAKSSIGYGEW